MEPLVDHAADASSSPIRSRRPVLRRLRDHKQHAPIILGVDPIEPTKALYIKLGKAGVWERDCLAREQTLRLGYEDVPHDLCLKGSWQEATENFRRGSPEMSAGTV